FFGRCRAHAVYVQDLHFTAPVFGPEEVCVALWRSRSRPRLRAHTGPRVLLADSVDTDAIDWRGPRRARRGTRLSAPWRPENRSTNPAYKTARRPERTAMARPGFCSCRRKHRRGS